MLIDVSFLLATFRPYEMFSKKTIQSIYDTKTDLKYEICVCSKEVINGDHIKYIPEPEDNNGSVMPFNLCAQNAIGKYLVLLNDEYTIDKDFFYAIEEAEQNVYKISGLYPKDWIDTNDIKHVSIYPNTIPVQMTCFPVVAKNTVKELLDNHIFNPKFKHHFSDCWLPYYFYKKYDFIITLCQKSLIYSNDLAQSPSSCFNHSNDESLFINLIHNFTKETIYI